MPERKTIKRAQKAKRQGKAPSTQASEFVREEMHHIREGKHGARNAKQAIAIGLSKARKAGVNIPEGKGKRASSDDKHIHEPKTSSARSKAGERRLKKEPKSAASHKALSMQAHRAAKQRTAAERHESAMKAARTREKNKKAA